MSGVCRGTASAAFPHHEGSMVTWVAVRSHDMTVISVVAIYCIDGTQNKYRACSWMVCHAALPVLVTD